MGVDTGAVFDGIAAAWTDGDFSALTDFVAADVKYHMPPVGDFDRDGLGQFITGFERPSPTFR